MINLSKINSVTGGLTEQITKGLQYLNERLPDLDQLINDFFKKLFNKKPKLYDANSGSSGVFNNSWWSNSLLVIAGIALVIYLAFGVYIVRPAEQAVVTRFGRFLKVEGAGPHWRFLFIDKVNIVNIENLMSSVHKGQILTKDENIILVEMEVQYRISDPEKYLFKASNADQTFIEAADSALRQAVGNSELEGDNDIMTVGKAKVTADIKRYLTSLLDQYDIGIYIDRVNFKEPSPPKQVENAFFDANRSREDKERFELEAQAYARKVVPEAEGHAKRLVNEAEAYNQERILLAKGDIARFSQLLDKYQESPQVTKTRLWTEAWEQVLSNSSKIVVDGDKQMLYLPLDKLQLGGNNLNLDGLNSDNSGLADQVNNSRNSIMSNSAEHARNAAALAQ